MKKQVLIALCAVCMTQLSAELTPEQRAQAEEGLSRPGISPDVRAFRMEVLEKVHPLAQEPILQSYQTLSPEVLSEGVVGGPNVKQEADDLAKQIDEYDAAHGGEPLRTPVEEQTPVQSSD